VAVPPDLSPDIIVNPLASCEDQVFPALEWFQVTDVVSLDGAFEFGQTHVVRADEDRLAPPVVAEREALLLFTPDTPLSETADMRVTASLGDVELGVIQASPPSILPQPLEQGLTSVELAPYSESAWSATLPWHWVKNGVELRVGVQEDDTLRLRTYVFHGLGAPHRFAVTRPHMVLFGEEHFQVTPPRSSTKIAREFHASVTGAELRWVNSSHWRLDGMVVNTAEGPRWVFSEAERLAITTDSNRWKILKHQTALRLSLANTGRGLRLTSPAQGDSSPYSFGTSMAQGWVHTGEGNYVDINNAGLAAGWTGWTGMWLDECGNGFIHEIGHSFTLAHFTAGTAAGWGIAEQYPNDGTNLSDHPWGYDTTRRQFRTWYRVDASGPVMNGGDLVGKRDPMNGGESSNALTCFPQYTAYHAQKMQAWEQNSPTITHVDGVPGVYRWDADIDAYALEEPAEGNQRPVKVGGPVITLIGTLGNIDEVCQTYPPIFIPSGNAFELPDPLDPDLPGLFNGARWFLEITYEDASSERALIKVGAIPETDTGLYLYSVNLDATRNPSRIDLYRAAVGYPELSAEDAELVHTRVIEPPASEPTSGVLIAGRGQLANGAIRLSQWCDPGFNCDARKRESVFLESSAAVSFVPSSDVGSDPVFCGEQEGYSSWMIPAISDQLVPASIVVHAQRVVSGGGETVVVPANDQTPWVTSPGMSQSLRLWIPYEENKGLPVGRYMSFDGFKVTVLKDGLPFSQIPLSVDLQVREAIEVELPPNYESEGLAIPSGDPDSSVYYVFEDGGIGPSGSKWWGNDSGNLISVPVVDEDTGEAAALAMRAHKIACGSWWEINTGQSSEWGCTHKVHLQLEAGGNDALESGHTYSSPGSHPVVINGVRWHAPNAGQVLGTLVLDITHTAP